MARDADGSLALIVVALEQAVGHARTLLRLVRERDPTPVAALSLRALHRRYQGARPP